MTEKLLFGGETLTDTSKADIARGYAVLAEEPATPAPFFPFLAEEPAEEGFLSRDDFFTRTR